MVEDDRSSGLIVRMVEDDRSSGFSEVSAAEAQHGEAVLIDVSRRFIPVDLLHQSLRPIRFTNALTAHFPELLVPPRQDE